MKLKTAGLQGLALFLLFALMLFSIVSLASAAGRLAGYEGLQASLGLVVFSALLLTGANAYLVYRSATDHRSKWIGAVLVSTFVAAIACGGAYWSYTTTPPYLIQSLAETATIEDVLGARGHIEGDIEIKVVKDGLKEIVWGNLGSTGVIKNPSFRAIGFPSSSRVVQEAGSWQASLKFQPPLHKGQLITVVLGFDVTDSPPDNKVELKHSVSWPTKNLQLTIVVPKERRCQRAEAESENANEIAGQTRHEDAPFLSESNTRITWARADVLEGRAYVLTCYW